MAENNKLDIYSKLDSIEELKFSSNLSNVDIDKNLWEVGFGFDTFADGEKTSLIISAGIALRQGEMILLECWYAFEYHIIGFNEAIEVMADNIRFEEGFMPDLLSMSFDTLRGILYVKTLGSKLEPFIFPMVNVESLISYKTAK